MAGAAGGGLGERAAVGGGSPATPSRAPAAASLPLPRPHPAPAPHLTPPGRFSSRGLRLRCEKGRFRSSSRLRDFWVLGTDVTAGRTGRSDRTDRPAGPDGSGPAGPGARVLGIDVMVARAFATPFHTRRTRQPGERTHSMLPDCSSPPPLADPAKQPRRRGDVTETVPVRRNSPADCFQTVPVRRRWQSDPAKSRTAFRVPGRRVTRVRRAVRAPEPPASESTSRRGTRGQEGWTRKVAREHE